MLITERYDTIELHIWDDEAAVLLSVVVDDENEIGFVLQPDQAVRLAKALHKYGMQLLDPDDFPTDQGAK